MTNLTILVQNIKKYFKPFLFVVIVIILLFLIILKYSSTKQESSLSTLDKPYFDKLATKTIIFYSQNLQPLKNPPKSLPTYTIQYSQNLLSNAESFASKLGFTDNPKEIKDVSRGRGRGYSNLGGALMIFKDEITYQKDFKNLPPTNINLENLKSKSLDYLKTLNLNTNFISDPEVSYTYLAEDTSETQDASKSGIVNLTYNQNIEGYKVFSPTYQAKIMLNSVGNVMGFTYKNLEVGQKQTSYPLISPNEAIDLALKNKGQLFEASGQSNVSTIKQLSPILLQSMYLGYFYNPLKPEIAAQPVWFFKGVSEYTNTKINVKIAVPAIQDKYFKNTTQP